MTEIHTKKQIASKEERVNIPLGPLFTPWLAVFSEICQKASQYAADYEKLAIAEASA